MNENDAPHTYSSQPPQEEKLKMATVIIQNDGTLEDLLLQVKHAWETDVPGYLPDGNTGRKLCLNFLSQILFLLQRLNWLSLVDLFWLP